jgi:hypothetical protein
MPIWDNTGFTGAQRLPALLLDFGRADVAAQRVPWLSPSWAGVLGEYRRLATALTQEVEQYGGIRRAFVHALAEADPVELFLAAMAWGFGPTPYGPARVNKMMATPSFATKVGRIVVEAQTAGAAAGWTSLLLTSKVPGLGMAYGTKLLYFAAYTSACPGPRPLVFDQFVRAALVSIGAQIPGEGIVWRNDYLTYLTLAEGWAADPAWNESPEAVEYALFSAGKMIANGTEEDDEAIGASGVAHPD